MVPSDLAEGAVLLFKMDIEGYESRALKGFTRTVGQASSVIGFIEFDGQYIRWAGQDPDDYLTWLQQHFRTYRVASWKAKQLVEVRCFADVPKLHGDPNRVHTDLVLVGRQNPEGWLAPAWSIRE